MKDALVVCKKVKRDGPLCNKNFIDFKDNLGAKQIVVLAQKWKFPHSNWKQSLNNFRTIELMGPDNLYLGNFKNWHVKFRGG